MARLLPLDEQVVDVPAKLSARMRVFATGRGRKTDDSDAHSIALVGARMGGLRRVAHDQTLERCRGCWSTGAVAWVKTTPGWCAS